MTPQSAGEQVEILVERGPAETRHAALRPQSRHPPDRQGQDDASAKATALAADYNAHLTGHLGADGLAEDKADLEEMARRI